MKKLCTLSSGLCFLLFLLALQTIAQQPATKWVARYNGPANKIDMVRAMAVDAAANIYVTGPSDGTKNGNVDIAIVKYDSAGQQKWAARYNGTGNGEDWPYAIAVGTDGVYVTGRSMGSSSALDIVTIKYDLSGSLKWVARYNGPGNLNDIPLDVKVDASGNAFVTGYENASNAFGPGASIVTLKYGKALGDQQWIAHYDQLPNDGTGTNMEQGVSLALDIDGSVYVTGCSAGMLTVKYAPPLAQPQWIRNGGSGSVGKGRKVLIDGANNVIVTSDGSKIVKYNAVGDLLWETTYPGNASFSDMVLDQAGNIYVTGFSQENGSNGDYRTVKYDANGIQQWSKGFNGSFNSGDFARSIAIDGAGNIYVTGHCMVNNGSRNGGTNYATVKYDNSGSEKWVQLYDSPDKSGSDAFEVATDASGNIYVSGQSATKASSNDFTTIKYSQPMAAKALLINPALPNSTVSNFQLRNYPNPFSQNTIIEYKLPALTNVRLSVFDLSGHEITTLVNENRSAGIHTLNFAANKLPSGIYVYRIQSGKFAEARKLVILK